MDQYSGRALSYNTEAEQAQNKALLLNVVRASQRRPMQFTTLSTISGTASASGTTGLSIPLGAGGAAYKSLTLGGGMSGGPTFAVPVLDTQDFYRGILTPITGQVIDLYLHSGYPSRLLYNLVIKRIVVTLDDRKNCPPPSHWRECELTFDNLVSDDIKIDAFQALVDHLIKMGLQTEPLNSQNADKPAKPKAKTADTSTDKAADSGNDPLTTPYVFCFAPRERDISRYVVENAVLCDSSTSNKPVARPSRATAKPSGAAAQTAQEAKPSGNEQKPLITPKPAPPTIKVEEQRQAAKITSTSKLSNVGLERKFFEELGEIAKRNAEYAERDSFVKNYIADIKAFTGNLKFTRGTKSNVKVTLHFYTRSAQNLIFYLGELVRRHLNPEYESSRVITIAGGNMNCPNNAGSPTTPIFVLENSALLGNAMSVNYDGTHYSVSEDSCVSGNTLQVLDMTRQLLAMNTSAKSLPQTGIISVVNAP